MELQEERLTRISTAPWFTTESLTIMVIGLGGIGSHLLFYLSRLGQHHFYIYDGDRYDSTNQAGQLTFSGDVGAYKTDAIEKTVYGLSPSTKITSTNFMYGESNPTNRIVFTGLDNIDSRRLVFEKWRNSYDGVENAIFFDGRLTADEFQILVIKGNDQNAMRVYEEQFLFDSSKAETPICTFKQTTHVAAMIGAYMTSIFTNWLVNQKSVTPDIDSVLFRVPFFTEVHTGLLTVRFRDAYEF